MEMKEILSRDMNGYSKKGFNYKNLVNDDAYEQCLIATVATYHLNDVVYGLLLGYKKLYIPLLNRVISWLKQGENNLEDSYDDFFKGYRLKSRLAIAVWLNNDGDKKEIWQQATSWIEKMNIDYANLTDRSDKDFFALQLLCYIQAEQYEKAIELFKLVTGKETVTLNNKMSGFRVAYAYCLYFYDKRFDLDKLEKATKPFLEKHLPMLYQMGRPTEMLFWLKTVCDAREKSYMPEEVVYSFYDYLPEEEKPDFVKDLLSGKSTEKKSFFSFFKR